MTSPITLTQEQLQSLIREHRDNGYTAGRLAGIAEERSRHPRSKEPRVRWVSTWQLIEDVLDMIPRIPDEVDLVVGVPRSGMIPASIIATALNIELGFLSEKSFQLVLMGGGRRVRENQSRVGSAVLVIDDSINTGGSLKGISSDGIKGFPDRKILTAAVYANPDALSATLGVNIIGREWPMPHLFEWHFFGSDLVSLSMFDMDGLICEDCPEADDDHGERYLTWLRSARPKWLPRPHRLGGICTGRSSLVSKETLQWLCAHGVDVAADDISYLPVCEPLDAIAAYKGEVYRKSGCRYFFESDVRQARVIFEVSRKPVICPATGDVFQEEIQ